LIAVGWAPIEAVDSAYARTSASANAEARIEVRISVGYYTQSSFYLFLTRLTLIGTESFRRTSISLVNGS
jgi:hypothetical protein